MHKILLALTGAALSAAVVAFPVYANQGPASPARTNTQFRITPGDLTITAPASANLGTGSQSGGTLVGHLGSVVVTDNRGDNPASWTASVKSSIFTDTSNGNTIPASQVTYAPGATTSSSGSGGVFTPGATVPLSASNQTAYTASGFVGANSATWNPTLTVNTSTGPAGTFTGVITHSVA